MKLHPVRDKSDIDLRDSAARVKGLDRTDDELHEDAEEHVERIAKRQRVLYADGRTALLIVLQGRDASGKDGTIRKVFSSVNPQGCSVTSFKAPSELELRHDYLWRVHAAVPARGMIGIFNRSHYEDVLVPRVHGTLGRKELERRCDEINDFERMLAANGTVILKFMLHVSRDEQKRRFEERLEDPEKNWKFRSGDLEDRARWDDFTKAYRAILASTSTDVAPWYVVPADDKHVRDLLVARRIADTLDDLDLEFPKLEKGLDKVRVE